MPQENVEASVKINKEVEGYGTKLNNKKRVWNFCISQEKVWKRREDWATSIIFFSKLLPILSRVNKNQTYSVLKRKTKSNILTRCESIDKIRRENNVVVVGECMSGGMEERECRRMIWCGRTIIKHVFLFNLTIKKNFLMVENNFPFSC